jgi:hypothetical protein
MDRRPFFWPNDVVCDRDLDGITPIGFNCRTRESPIDQYDRPRDTIRCDRGSSKIEGVASSNAGSRHVQLRGARYDGCWEAWAIQVWR